MLVGIMFNCILLGILVMQMFIYFQTYKADRTWMKVFVTYLFIVEIINTGCDIGLIYQPLILEFGMPSAVTFYPTSELSSSPFNFLLVLFSALCSSHVKIVCW